MAHEYSIRCKAGECMACNRQMFADRRKARQARVKVVTAGRNLGTAAEVVLGARGELRTGKWRTTHRKPVRTFSAAKYDQPARPLHSDDTVLASRPADRGWRFTVGQAQAEGRL